MKPTTILMSLEPEKIIAKSSMFPYWEIRNANNSHLMSKSSENSKHNYFDNNPSKWELEKALDETMEYGRQTNEPYLIIMLSQGRQYPLTKQHFIVNLSENEQDLQGVMPLNGGQPNQFVFQGGFQGSYPHNNQQDVTALLAGYEQKMSAAYDKKMNDFVAAQNRKEFEKEKKELAEKEARLLELEAKIKEDTEKKQFDWNTVLNGLPQLVNGVASIYSMATGKVVQTGTLAGAPTETIAPTPPVAKKASTVTFKVKEPENKPVTTEPIIENKNDLFSDLSQEEIEALLAAKKAIKEGKLNAAELQEVVANPEAFFIEEEEVTDKNEEVTDKNEEPVTTTQE